MTNWTTLYNQWQLPLQRMAHRYVHNHQLAEDIVHDVFLCLLEKNMAPTFMHHAEAYLRRAVYHRCMSHFRKKALQQSIDEWATFESGVNTTEQQILYRELKTLHHQLMQALPRSEKEVYLLRSIEGFSRDEMAIALGRSAKTIKKQLQVSNKKMRQAVLALSA